MSRQKDVEKVAIRRPKMMAVRGVPLFQKWLLIPICTDCSIR